MRRTITRRDFVLLSAAAAAGCATEPRRPSAVEQRAGTAPRVTVGLIGCGGRGMELLEDLRGRASIDSVEVGAVCDVFAPRLERARTVSGADACRRWQDLVARKDLEGVVIATPNHWHAAMAIAAMESGKDVYCEKPMCLRLEEGCAFRDCAARTGRVVQIGVQQLSEPQWRAAYEIVRSGALGPLRWGQGSYEPIADCGLRIADSSDPTSIRNQATPDTLDWEAFLGDAPKQPFDAERFFHWRKYWDYSGGVATELHYHKLAALLAATGGEFPERVSAAGGVYAADGREVPDSFVMNARYPDGHSIVLAAGMAVPRGQPAILRGAAGAVELCGDHLRVIPEDGGAIETKALDAQGARDHLGNWLDCMRTRGRCACDAEAGYRAMVAVAMAIEAYRSGKTVYYDRGKDRILGGVSRT